MATILQYRFCASDPAAAPTGAALLACGAADSTDYSQFVLPVEGRLIGISVDCAPASGDTVTGRITVGGTVQAAPAPQATSTNGAPHSATWVSRVNAPKVAAGSLIGANYLTTTGSSYTVNDVAITVYIQVGDDGMPQYQAAR